MDIATIVDGVVVVFLIEVVVLGALGGRVRALPPLPPLLPNLAAGLFLVLAVRSAVRQDGFAAIASFLALGGIAHVLDLRARAKRRS